MRSWSLGRKAGQKPEAERDASRSTRRPDFVTHDRPSSMVSLSFPSALDHSEEAKLSEHGATASSPARTSHEEKNGALHLLSAAQQRDNARRERKASSASSKSTSSIHEPSTASPTARTPVKQRNRISTTTLPSLIKSPATRSPALSSASLMSENVMTAKASTPSPSRERYPVTATPVLDQSASRKQEQRGDRGNDLSAREYGSQDTPSIASTSSSKSHPPTRKSGPLSNITNEAQVERQGASYDAKQDRTAVQTEIVGRITKASDKTKDEVPGKAVDSLLRLQGKKMSNFRAPHGKEGREVALTLDTASIGAHPDDESVDGQVAGRERETVPETLYPYVVRQHRNKARHLPNGCQEEDANAEQHKQSARYEVAIALGRSKSLRFSQPSRGQLGLVGMPIPPVLGWDRLAAWAVERSARLAACVVDVLGS